VAGATKYEISRREFAGTACKLSHCSSAASCPPSPPAQPACPQGSAAASLTQVVHLPLQVLAILQAAQVEELGACCGRHKAGQQAKGEAQ